MELKELARVGSVRALSTSAIGLLEDEVVDYAECYFAFLLSQDRCKDAAAAALQRLEIIRGVETREELLDVLDVSPLLGVLDVLDCLHCLMCLFCLMCCSSTGSLASLALTLH